MTIEALIQAKKAQRTRDGLHIRVEFEGRDPFDAYYNSVKRRDAALAHFNERIGKPDEISGTVTAVYIVQ